MECFKNNYKFTPVVSSSLLVELNNNDSGMFSVAGPVWSKNDEFSLKKISSSKRISNNLSNVEEMGIALSALSIDSLGMLYIDGMRISSLIHPELFGDNKPETNDNLSFLKQRAGEHISIDRKWVSGNLSDDDESENDDNMYVFQENETDVRSSK